MPRSSTRRLLLHASYARVCQLQTMHFWICTMQITLDHAHINGTKTSPNKTLYFRLSHQSDHTADIPFGCCTHIGGVQTDLALVDMRSQWVIVGCSLDSILSLLTALPTWVSRRMSMVKPDSCPMFVMQLSTCIQS